MPVDFPFSPSVNQIYTYQGKSWQWNGYAWDVYPVDPNAITFLNGFTGNVTIAGGTAISIENALNTITVSYTGTGGGGGVTTGTSNTFIPLQTFNSGISAFGATFGSQARFLSGISASGGIGVTGGATFNGNVRVNATNTLFLNKIESLSGSQVQIEDRANARVSLGDFSGAGQSTNIFIRDTGNILEISNPYGSINIGDPQLRNSTVFLSYSADLAELNGNGSSLVNFSSTSVNKIDVTQGVSAAEVSAGSYILSSSGIKSLTGITYTFLTTDNGKILTFNNSSSITVTIPAALPVGFICTAIQLGTGQVGFTAASGVTLQSYLNQFKIIGQHGSATLREYATNIVNISGNLTT